MSANEEQTLLLIIAFNNGLTNNFNNYYLEQTIVERAVTQLIRLYVGGISRTLMSQIEKSVEIIIEKGYEIHYIDYFFEEILLSSNV